MVSRTRPSDELSVANRWSDDDSIALYIAESASVDVICDHTSDEINDGINCMVVDIARATAIAPCYTPGGLRVKLSSPSSSVFILLLRRQRTRWSENWHHFCIRLNFNEY